ncbi:hypothetical protein CES85_1836 [Ochrobactrum quorumnocens]|uniref:Uncharacterized protein n=1 Tax=Ochrobactrum quorumnocens TaxID=271865 RepID=A0A248UFV9_9HYPH|nr:hypothetical protein CES85_1836 [[Ochrobactrum] quorumnocens]
MFFDCVSVFSPKARLFADIWHAAKRHEVNIIVAKRLKIRIFRIYFPL